ncbi:inorganic pyrophosphatase [Corallococcus sp. AB004]|uniref:inorganic pyrophosphatase n=1 Tax=Corallococcus TaxID=83461 RepID=UPI000EA1D5AC|nr:MULTISPECIES: inorganic pyrophosphatase [Corallococcus]NPC73638.1 inorganic pyrophosphatase [Corallococcus exiguus]NRD48167.1 inorganic pyrophosphatase [Corallococcus exiguus]RKH98929.1 inorganic pyrophosphatase [Corallococcus sp. AB038B]RKI36686.1 inorganic pyrophosphatase [Corallococcus sp. AB004]
MKKSTQTQSQAHPWHGISPGPEAPEVVTAYIEIVPTDAVKYEMDKESGILMLDRPQRFSSQCPTLYGFIPRTYCGEQVAKRCAERTGHKDIHGDGDPIDICVLTEKVVSNGNLLVHAVPVGGFRMVDGNEADDKIIAVLESDLVYGELQYIAQLPRPLLDRLKHYFLTYKQIPGEGKRSVEIAEVYDRQEAMEVIRRSMRDYDKLFVEPEAKPAKKSAPAARRKTSVAKAAAKGRGNRSGK